MSILIEIITSILILFMIFGVALSINKATLVGHKHHAQLILSVKLFVVLLHIIASVHVGTGGSIFGADRDAVVFYLASFPDGAAQMPEGYGMPQSIYVTGWFYSVFLSKIYALTTVSWVVGCLLSTLCFSILCFSVMCLYRLLSGERKRISINYFFEIKIILLIGAIPVSIVLTSITMREVYQMLFMCLSVLYSVKYLQTSRLINVIYMLFALTSFATLHGSFIYYVGIYLLCFVLFNFRKSLAHVSKKSKILLFVIGLVAILIMDINWLYAMVSKFIEGIDGAEEARAYYGLPGLSADSLSILKFMLLSFANYLIRPFPWEVTSIVDIPAMLENALRIYFLAYFVVHRRHFSAALAWTVFAALLLEQIWAMGTLNWGTAERHHLVAWPLLVVAYYALKAKMINSNLNFKKPIDPS